MKITKKVLITLIAFFIISLSLVNTSKVEALTLSEMQNQTQEFLNKGKDGAGNVNGENIFEDLVDLGSILTTIGAGVLVAVTLYMGIKYITATPEAQAKLKQQLIGLVVSGFVIFGAYFIWKIVISIVEKF